MGLLRKFGLFVALLALSVAVLSGQVLAQRQLVIVSGTDAVTLDAHYITDSPSATVAEHIVEPLLELTPDGEIVPHLAEGWEVPDDGLVGARHPRRGVAGRGGRAGRAEA